MIECAHRHTVRLGWSPNDAGAVLCLRCDADLTSHPLHDTLWKRERPKPEPPKH